MKFSLAISDLLLPKAQSGINSVTTFLYNSVLLVSTLLPTGICLECIGGINFVTDLNIMPYIMFFIFAHIYRKDVLKWTKDLLKQ